MCRPAAGSAAPLPGVGRFVGAEDMLSPEALPLHTWLIRMNHASRTQAAERRLWTRRGSAVAPSGCAPTPRPPLQGRVTMCRPFGSPQVCGPRGRIPPTLTRSSERLGHGFSPRFCRRAPKAREASKGGAHQAAPVGRGGRGMWVPGSQVSRPSGPLAAGMKSVRPCSRHRLAPRPLRPTHAGHAAHLALFSNSCRSAVAQPHQATSCASPAVGTRNASWLKIREQTGLALAVSSSRGVLLRRVLCGVTDHTTKVSTIPSDTVCVHATKRGWRRHTTHTALSQRPSAPQRAPVPRELLSHMRTPHSTPPAPEAEQHTPGLSVRSASPLCLQVPFYTHPPALASALVPWRINLTGV